MLKLLLPEASATLKGRFRSDAELLAASGYADRPTDFDELIRILDGELRLITLIDSPVPADAAVSPAENKRYYQLTHDFLVQSVRDWVTRRQQATLRGRAALRLAERTRFWTRNPENRYLPSLLEWAGTLLFTSRRQWSDPERRMMGRASWINGLILGGAVAVLAVLAVAGTVTMGVIHADSLVPNLLVTELDHLPQSIAALEKHRWRTDPELRRVLAENPDGSDRKLRASLALLPVDPSQREYLFGQLQHAGPDQVFVLRSALRGHADALTPRLRDLLRHAPDDGATLLPTAAALAGYSPEDVVWREVSTKVAQALVRADFISLRHWLAALRPVRHQLSRPLALLYQADPRAADASKIADILADYAADNAALAAEVLLDAEPAAFGPFFQIAVRNPDQALPIWRAELVRAAPPEAEPFVAERRGTSSPCARRVPRSPCCGVGPTRRPPGATCDTRRSPASAALCWSS